MTTPPEPPAPRRPEDETIAALLSGKLRGEERDEVLAYLAEHDEDFEVFGSSAVILRAMEEEDAATAPAKLRECPFCGESEDPDMVHLHAAGSNHFVRCDECQTEGPSALNEANAVRWWNTRPGEKR